MKIISLKSRAFFALSATVCAFALVGCGGGGSGGGSSSGPSTPTTNVSVTVQLRDPANAPVEGLVTLDGQRRATTGGDAAFTNVSRGAQTASAEVNGVAYTKRFVATPGANVVPIAIEPSASTPGGGTPPAPPF